MGQVPAAWQGLDDFDLLLRLFDCSAWRPILGQRFASQYGPPPFDPVSLGLAWLLALWRGWSWPQLVTELHSGERGQGYARRLGFRSDDLPSAATFRMALNATAPAWVVQCADSWALSLLAYGLIPSHSTFPHDPAERGISIALDSQLVAARSHMRCRHMNADCFLPQTERRCAAQADGQEGCTCDTPACQDQCRLATPRDPEAAYVYYKGSNQTPGAPPPRRTAPQRTPPHPPGAANITLAIRAKPSMCSTTACAPTGRWPAPMPPPTATTICKPFPASRTCAAASPRLTIGEVTADAGEGYDDILTYVHDDLRGACASSTSGPPKTTRRR